ncbi:IclR family transcriptional regulator [Alkalibacter mobilis]|uniref:IclR family transcriptional regulator n=1 Tax=Alkalibacter mobilis TaxID=2787712 RepID=UPI00189E0BD3|nr:IclR family transcriptional regulator [Alkalibacter mobilis]MBF7097828.1 IclR family transcriptional regulator [Alkalibacter mobilis]
MDKNSDVKVKSLEKAMKILECFSVNTPELGITQIAEKLDLSKSNVHNIVSTFAQMGYLEQQPNGKYSMGFKVLEFSFVVNEHLGYARAVYDIINDISQRSGEIVYFGIPYRDKVLYLYVAHPMSRLQMMPYREILGETAPLFCTGIGKAILAFLPEEEWDDRITKDRKAFTENTILDYDEIIKELKETKARGYSIDNAEREPHIRCVGMPVYNMAGKLVAAISISGPIDSMTDEKLAEHSKLLGEEIYRMKQRLYK